MTLLAGLLITAGMALAQTPAQAPPAPPARPSTPPATPQPAPPASRLTPAAPDLFDMEMKPTPMPPVRIDHFDEMERIQEKLELLRAHPMPYPSPAASEVQMLQEKVVRMANEATRLELMKAPMALAQNVTIAGKGRFQNDDRVYDAGQRAIDQRRWDEALEDFTHVASRGGARADGALYWKAYTLGKMGRRDDALAAIAELRKSFASSRWLDDAKALELEVKQSSGQRVSPESESDEELKLMALNGLMQSDPDRAFPALESLLKGSQSPRLKKNAIFVLAQSNSPRAQQLLEQVARGQGNPDLQLSAIRYLGERRRQAAAPVLAEIYNASNDAAVKRAVLNSLQSNREKDRLFQIAKSEKTQELRLEAIRALAGMNTAQAELWQLYQAEATPEGKMAILDSIPQTGNMDKFLELARTEKDSKLRRVALRNLGSTRSATTGDALATLYASEQDADIKREIVSTLASQKNAHQLITIAKKEPDAKMKQRILEHLVNMRSPEVTEYLLEILK